MELTAKQLDNRRKALNLAMRWLSRMVLEGESLRDNPPEIKMTVQHLHAYAGTLVREEQRLPLDSGGTS